MRSDEKMRRLYAGLKAQGIAWPGGAENMEIRRTYAGRHQRSAGAWSWCLVTADGTLPYRSIGSRYRADECARGFVADDDGYGDIHLTPVEAVQDAVHLPTARLLARLLDRKCSPEEREEVMRQLAEDPETLEVFADAAALMDETA